MELFSGLITAILLMACLSEKREEGVVDGYFITILLSNFGMLVSDAFSQFIIGDDSNAILVKILALISFALSHTSTALYACYIVNYLTRETHDKVFRIDMIAIWVLTVEVIMWIFFLPTDMFIYLDEIGRLQSGKMYFISIVGILAVCAGIVIVIMGFRDRLERKVFRNMLFYVMLPFASVPFIWLWDSTVVYIAITISSLVFYTELHVNQTIEKAEQERVIARQKTELTKSQTRLLVSQMQPHFLYNVLNTIYYLTEKDTEVAQKAISDFSDYLRMNLDSIRGDDRVPFEKELKHAKTYLELEKLRFEDELNIEYDIQYTDFYMASLSLQPIVENAVKHGIGKKLGGGTVRISTAPEEDFVVIRVDDDGVGFDENELEERKLTDERSHVGLESVRNRIKLISNGTMMVESAKNEGTKITIRIPVKTKKGDKK